MSHRQPSESLAAADSAALMLRVAIGTVFVAHALVKLLDLTLPGTAAFFVEQGFPGWMAYPVFAAELGGGLALILGIYTRVASVMLIPVLLGAFTVHWPNGWYFGAPRGGWEYIAVLIVTLGVQAILGDGRWALVVNVWPVKRWMAAVESASTHHTPAMATSHKSTFLYWAFTLCVAVTSLWAGLNNLLHATPFFEELLRLGYPPHFGTLLGAWKVLGTVALLVPRFPLIKEWAYAGFFFDFSGAIVACASSGDGAVSYVGPILAMGALTASWCLRPCSRRLADATPSGLHPPSECPIPASRHTVAA
jgi:putative oxidoreductase